MKKHLLDMIFYLAIVVMLIGVIAFTEEVLNKEEETNLQTPGSVSIVNASD